MRESSQNVPKPLNNIIPDAVLVIVSVHPKILDIDVGKARNQELQLRGSEDRDHLHRHKLIKAIQEARNLRMDRGSHAVVRDEADVVDLILVGDQDIATIGDQVDNLLRC